MTQKWATGTEVGEFFKAKSKEIDSLYEAWGEQLSRAYFSEPDYVSPKLTTGQRLRWYTWKVRGWLAAPFAWVVKVLDPSRLDQGDD